jgi:hypothetical protein
LATAAAHVPGGGAPSRLQRFAKRRNDSRLGLPATDMLLAVVVYATIAAYIGLGVILGIPTPCCSPC